jgi:hypothetical protein
MGTLVNLSESGIRDRNLLIAASLGNLTLVSPDLAPTKYRSK